MMKSNLFAPTIIAALTIAVTFTGCQTTSPSSDRFAKADANHDGKLSLDEANTYLVTTVFESRDSNHDKQMTVKEWAVEGDSGYKKGFHDRDTNHNGVVSLDEALAYGKKKGTAAKFMKEADTDKDGFVSRAEASAFYAKREGSPH